MKEGTRTIYLPEETVEKLGLLAEAEKISTEQLVEKLLIEARYDVAAAKYKAACVMGDERTQQQAATTMQAIDKRLAELHLEN